MYTSLKTEISDRVHHYRLLKNDKPVKYQTVLELWKNNAVFSAWYSATLAQSPFQAFRWETPVLTRYKLSKNFEYVLVSAESFVTRPVNGRAFSDHFSESSVVSFSNLGGDGLMIVPCPRTDEANYGHFAAFLRGAPEDQIINLWQTIGEQIPGHLINDSPKWLSTAGGGVAWLHVRLDSRPKYYHYSPYRDLNHQPYQSDETKSLA